MNPVPEVAAPYLIFLGDAPDSLAVKTGAGVVEWRRDRCLGQLRLPDCGATLGLPDLTVEAAAEAGARTLVIGVVNAGGVLPAVWEPTLRAAIEAGMDVASGMHVRLASVPGLADLAARAGRKLIDLRLAGGPFTTGDGEKRSGKRLLTVGTDCAVGKKYTALAIAAELDRRGVPATFRATGQTGVLISGSGLAMDAVVADFIAGAAEALSPANAPDHWDVIEGQGSLFHPSYAGVTLGLLHGSQPDAFVVCHEPGRPTMRGVSHPLPTIAEVIDLTIRHGRLTNPRIRCVGISINTSGIDEETAQSLLAVVAQEHGLPVIDPLRFGPGPLVETLI